MGDSFHNLKINGGKLIRDLKVVELKLALEERGLSKLGNKKELIQRLSIFEENHQKSLSDQPSQGTPNQWLENEADLNNDFLREYFKSQKALFQEHIAHQKGVSESPRQSTSTFTTRKLPPISDDLGICTGSSSPSSSLSTQLHVVTDSPAPTSPRSRGRPKKRHNCKDKEISKSVDHVTNLNVTPEEDTNPVRTLRSRTSSTLDSLGENRSSPSSTSTLSPQSRHAPRKTRSDNVDLHSPQPTFKSESPNVDNSLDSSRNKVPSLRIKLPESVPKSSTINSSIEENSVSKIKSFKDSEVLNLSPNDKSYLSPQNAEVSSSVQEETPKKPSLSKCRSNSQPVSAETDAALPSSSIPQDLEKDGLPSVKSPPKKVEGLAITKLSKAECNVSSKPQALVSKWKQDNMERKREHPKVRGRYLTKELTLPSNRASSIESKIKKDLINLRLKSSDSIDKELTVNIYPLKKSKDNLSRTSRLSKPDVPKRSIPNANKTTDLKIKDSSTLSQTPTSAASNPDFFESLKQQIEMPLHIEKFPQSDKIEVSSTSELSECPKTVDAFRSSKLNVINVSRETPILDAHIAVEGHLDETIVSDRHSVDLAKSNIDEKKSPSKMPINSVPSVSSEASINISKKKSYSIEHLIDINKDKTQSNSLSTLSITPVVPTNTSQSKSATNISHEPSQKFSEICSKTNSSQVQVSPMSVLSRSPISECKENPTTHSSEFSPIKEKSSSGMIMSDILKEATLAADIEDNSYNCSESKDITSIAVPVISSRKPKEIPSPIKEQSLISDKNPKLKGPVTSDPDQLEKESTLSKLKERGDMTISLVSMKEESPSSASKEDLKSPELPQFETLNEDIPLKITQSLKDTVTVVPVSKEITATPEMKEMKCTTKLKEDDKNRIITTYQANNKSSIKENLQLDVNQVKDKSPIEPPTLSTKDTKPNLESMTTPDKPISDDKGTLLIKKVDNESTLPKNGSENKSSTALIKGSTVSVKSSLDVEQVDKRKDTDESHSGSQLTQTKAELSLGVSDSKLEPVEEKVIKPKIEISNKNSSVMPLRDKSENTEFSPKTVKAPSSISIIEQEKGGQEIRTGASLSTSNESNVLNTKETFQAVNSSVLSPVKEMSHQLSKSVSQSTNSLISSTKTPFPLEETKKELLVTSEGILKTFPPLFLPRKISNVKDKPSSASKSENRLKTEDKLLTDSSKTNDRSQSKSELIDNDSADKSRLDDAKQTPQTDKCKTELPLSDNSETTKIEKDEKLNLEVESKKVELKPPLKSDQSGRDCVLQEEESTNQYLNVTEKIAKEVLSSPTGAEPVFKQSVTSEIRNVKQSIVTVIKSPYKQDLSKKTFSSKDNVSSEVLSVGDIQLPKSDLSISDTSSPLSTSCSKNSSVSPESLKAKGKTVSQMPVPNVQSLSTSNSSTQKLKLKDEPLNSKYHSKNYQPSESNLPELKSISSGNMETKLKVSDDIPHKDSSNVNNSKLSFNIKFLLPSSVETKQGQQTEVADGEESVAVNQKNLSENVKDSQLKASDFPRNSHSIINDKERISRSSEYQPKTCIVNKDNTPSNDDTDKQNKASDDEIKSTDTSQAQTCSVKPDPRKNVEKTVTGFMFDLSSIPLPSKGMFLHSMKAPSKDVHHLEPERPLGSSYLSEVEQMARSSRSKKEKSHSKKDFNDQDEVRERSTRKSSRHENRGKSPAKDVESASLERRRTRSSRGEAEDEEKLVVKECTEPSVVTKKNGVDASKDDGQIHSVSEELNDKSGRESGNNVDNHDLLVKEKSSSVDKERSNNVGDTDKNKASGHRKKTDSKDRKSSKRSYSPSSDRKSTRKSSSPFNRDETSNQKTISESPIKDDSKLSRSRSKDETDSLQKSQSKPDSDLPSTEPKTLNSISGESLQENDDLKGDKDPKIEPMEIKAEQDKTAVKIEESFESAVKQEEVEFKSARKVTLHRSRSTGEDDKEERTKKKKKWGTATASSESASMEISSDSLKSIMPDVKPLSPGELTLQLESSGKEMEEFSKELDEDLLSGKEEGEMSPLSSKTKSKTDESSEKQIGEKAKITADKLTIVAGEETEKMRDKEKIGREQEKSSHRSRRSRSPRERRRDRGDRERAGRGREVNSSSRSHAKRSGSNDRSFTRDGRKVRVVETELTGVTRKVIKAHPISPVLTIRNLVRPFTLKQLKQLLLRTGKIVPDGFWIDGIKSKCIVKFENEDQALETRMALHGVKWPSSNPKTLHVEYCSEDELEKKIAEGFNPLPPTDENRVERKRYDTIVREWDLEKLGERSPGEREREKEKIRREREERRAKKQEEEMQNEFREKEKVVKKPAPVVKSLDDLFKKTKAQPSIYWLPLTADQITQKEELRRKRIDEAEKRYAELRLEREKQRQEREEEMKRRQEQRERRRERERERRNSRRSRSRSRRRSRSHSGSRRSPRPSRRSGSGDPTRKSKSRSVSRS